VLAALRRRLHDPALTGTLAVLRLLPQVSLPLTLLLAACVVIATALPLGFTVLSGLLVGSVPAAVHGGLHSAAGRHALVLLAVVVALSGLQRLLIPVIAAAASVFGRAVDRHLRGRVITAVGRPRGVAHLEDPAVLDLVRAAQGVSAGGSRPGDAVAALASLLPDWLSAMLSAVLLIGFNAPLAVAWLLAWPVLLAVLQREYVQVGQTAGGESAAVRRAEYFTELALSPEAAKEVRIWGLTDWLGLRFITSWTAAMQPIWAARTPGRGAVWGTSALVAAFGALLYGLLGWSAVHGEIGLAALAIYATAVGRATGFRAFDDQNMTLAFAAVAVPSLLELERRTGGIPAREEQARAQRTRVVGPNESIRFRDVSFRYPGQEHDILHGLDLELPAGRSLAVVGANGAGKTTLVKLLCGLYEPTAGRIEVDGQDLAEIDPTAWQERLAAIFQDFSRYALTARENVTLGAPLDDAALQRAATRAGALPVIDRLPNGWETVLSRQFTGGDDLSGGQWQRVALVRALYAVERGARVLVLDEPAANLDVRAEAELYDRFLDLTAGLTTIVISHRFSTVRRADRIVVLDGGRIAESGSHDELMALGGRYAHMFRLQADRFVGEPVLEEL
jgi:ATP-binding cassette, subfamily B, bacterial